MVDYQLEWHRFKKLRDIYLIVFGSNFVIDLMETFIPSNVLPPASRARFDFIEGVTWGIALLLMGQHIYKWKCPRCGKSFYGGYKAVETLRTCMNWLFLPKQCASCGLPKYSTDPNAGAATTGN